VSPEFVLYTRRDCGLCVEMRDALHAAAGSRPYQCRLVDVDEDPVLRRRFGTRVPVLVAGGRVLCEAHFDETVVREYLDGSGDG
jgi:thioredoxin reductase (NADPH)